MVLRRLGQTVKGLPGFQIASHRFETGGDGDFVVGQPTGRKRIMIPILALRGVALVIVPL